MSMKNGPDVLSVKAIVCYRDALRDRAEAVREVELAQKMLQAAQEDEDWGEVDHWTDRCEEAAADHLSSVALLQRAHAGLPAEMRRNDKPDWKRIVQVEMRAAADSLESLTEESNLDELSPQQRIVMRWLLGLDGLNGAHDSIDEMTGRLHVSLGELTDLIVGALLVVRCSTG